MAADKAKRKTLRQRLTPAARALALIASSAYAWYALLAVMGASVLSTGVALEYGIGHGLIAFGVLSVAASEMVRRGMMRA